MPQTGVIWNHRKGIGQKLFNLAIQDRPVSEMTVNSSSYAIEVYKRFGFKPIAEEQETNGLRYTPMRRNSI
ncbi:MAG: GNAT family N-acetyltransferase [Parabacteroides sp.]|nr:GNAT family N-acetyltransferase [Parabacteroides sp.]